MKKKKQIQFIEMESVLIWLLSRLTFSQLDQKFLHLVFYHLPRVKLMSPARRSTAQAFAPDALRLNPACGVSGSEHK